jgi:hypothetical protein
VARAAVRDARELLTLLTAAHPPVGCGHFISLSIDGRLLVWVDQEGGQQSVYLEAEDLGRSPVELVMAIGDVLAELADQTPAPVTVG